MIGNEGIILIPLLKHAEKVSGFIQEPQSVNANNKGDKSQTSEYKI